MPDDNPYLKIAQDASGSAGDDNPYLKIAKAAAFDPLAHIPGGNVLKASVVQRGASAVAEGLKPRTALPVAGPAKSDAELGAMRQEAEMNALKAQGRSLNTRHQPFDRPGLPADPNPPSASKPAVDGSRRAAMAELNRIFGSDIKKKTKALRELDKLAPTAYAKAGDIQGYYAGEPIKHDSDQVYGYGPLAIKRVIISAGLNPDLLPRDDRPGEANAVLSEAEARGERQTADRKQEKLSKASEAVNQIAGKIVGAVNPASYLPGGFGKASREIMEGVGENAAGFINPVSMAEFATGIITDPNGSLEGLVNSIGHIAGQDLEGKHVSWKDRTSGVIALVTTAMALHGGIAKLKPHIETLKGALNGGPKTPESRVATALLEKAKFTPTEDGSYDPGTAPDLKAGLKPEPPVITAADIQRKQLVDTFWRDRTESLLADIERVSPTIEDPAPRGSKKPRGAKNKAEIAAEKAQATQKAEMGKLAGELRQSLESGKPHPAIVAELHDIHGAQNAPAESPAPDAPVVKTAEEPALKPAGEPPAPESRTIPVAEIPPTQEPPAPVTPTPKRTAADALADFQRLKSEIKDAYSAGTFGGEKLSKVIEAGGYLIEAGYRTLDEFTAQMVEHFGEEVRPQIEAIFKEAGGKVEPEVKVEEVSALKPEPAPEPKSKPIAQKTTGTSQAMFEQRGLDVKPGKGASPEEMMRRGRDIEHEADTRITRFEGDAEGRISENDIASFRARDEVLQRKANKALEAYDANPNKTTHDALQQAQKAVQDWAKRIKPAETKFQPIGSAMQGKTELDTGSWSSLAGEAARVRGGDGIPRPDEIKTAKKHALEVQTWKDRLDEVNKKVQDILSRQTKRTRTATAEKLPTNNKSRAEWIARRKADGTLYSIAAPKNKQGGGRIPIGPEQALHPDVVQVIWEHAKDNYIDPRTEAGRAAGPMDIGDIIDRTSHDLGLEPQIVQDALAGRKSPIGKLTDTARRIASERRRAESEARNFVAFAKTPKARKILNAIWGHLDPRGLAVLGHGTVGMFTHAGPVAFSPMDMANWGKSFVDQFRMVADKGNHEALMNWLESHPLYHEMKANGLKVDIGVTEDYQQYAMSREKMLGRLELKAKAFAAKGGGRQVIGAPLGKAAEIVGGGNRGFDALKILRARMYDDYMKGIPAELRNEIGPEMARLINTATGSGNMKTGAVANAALFAAPLEVSRWERSFVDPYKTARTFANQALSKVGAAAPPSASELWMAKFRAKRTGKLMATYASALGVNYALQTWTGQKDKVNFFDPTRNDWLRFRWNGVTLDPLGGAPGPAKLLAGLIAIGTSDPTKFQVQTGQSRKDRASEMLGGYALNKLSPTLSVPLELGLFKHDFQGNPLPNATKAEKDKARGQGKHTLTWKDYVIEHGPIPLADVYESVHSGMKAGGMKDGPAKMLLGVLGRAVFAATGIREGLSPKPRKKP